MKKEKISTLTNNFEDYAYEEEGVEFWFARDLQVLLGYSKWENFQKVLEKAKIACENAGFKIKNHFPDVRKKVENVSGSTKIAKV